MVGAVGRERVLESFEGWHCDAQPEEGSGVPSKEGKPGEG